MRYARGNIPPACPVRTPQFQCEMRETIEYVLLVDDEDDYHFITRIVLKKAGFNGKFECFYSADEAMARLRTDSTKPDLILLDINLPDMDGYAVTQCLREHPATKGIPVIAVSASAMPRDLERSRAACFAAYVTKPIDLGQLLRKVDELALPADSV